MAAEWIVAAVLVFVGLVAAVGFYLGNRDAVTRAYKPGIGSPLLGRISFRSPFGKKRDDDANDGGPRANSK
jgi:hypothetical protein